MSNRILGIDPGLTRCGYGVIDANRSRKAELVEVGVFQSATSVDISGRVGGIADQVEALIDRLNPAEIAIERVFSQSNVSTVMGVAQITGAIMFIAHKRGLSVALHTPTAVKAAVTGHGKANKQAVAKMVCAILSLSEVPKPVDATDALALAICHSWTLAGGSQQATQTAAQRKWASAMTQASRGR